MSFVELVKKNRSCRRFRQDRLVDRETLATLVDAARLVASGGNRQPLRYRLVWRDAERRAVFPLTRWAGLLKDWNPSVEEQPAAYIAVLAPVDHAGAQVDAGIAMQTIQLCACERGIAACMLGSIDRDAIKKLLSLPKDLHLLNLVALGYPAEQAVLEEAREGNVDYYRTPDGLHHVPKRPLNEVLLPEGEG